MKLLLTLIGAVALVIHAANVNAQDLQFYKPTAAKTDLKAEDAVCVYLANGYRPVTKLAVAAVKAAGSKTCNDKAEAKLHAKTGKMFVKLNKTKLGEARYNEIKALYYKFLAK